MFWSLRKPGNDGTAGAVYGSTLGLAGAGQPTATSGGIAEIRRRRPGAGRAPVLADGGVVAFTYAAGGRGHGRPSCVESYSTRGRDHRSAATVEVPAPFVRADGLAPGPRRVLSPAVAAAARRRRSRRSGCWCRAPRSPRTRSSDVEGGAAGCRGGRPPSTSSAATRPTARPWSSSWSWLRSAAVLMLGGTLTATFLALSDARPDLATLSAVGASPRMRRGVAASYALVVGLRRRACSAPRSGSSRASRSRYPLTERLGLRADVGDGVALPRRAVADDPRRWCWRCRCSPRPWSVRWRGRGCRW